MKVLSVLAIICTAATAVTAAAAQSQYSQYQDPAGAFPALQSNFTSHQEEQDQVGDLTIFR